jgi:uncharacterized Tic20 family protein
MGDAMEQVAADTSRDARKWATICHLSALVGLLNGVGFVLGPLIVWLLKREDHPFIDEQGKETLNFQITMFIVLLLAGILVVIGVGFLVMIAVFFLMAIFPIIGAIKANEGAHYRYPLTWRLIK